MSSRERSHRPLSAPASDTGIDALYGLEPVFEPGADAGADRTPFVTVSCPYCGEPFDARLDLSAGSASYIEDCQICCRPIEMRVRVGDDGTLAGVRAECSD